MKQPFMDDDEEMNSNGDVSGAACSGRTRRSRRPRVPTVAARVQSYYKSYFDVDTVDVVSRIKSSTIYCGQDDQFVNMIDEKPDLYGPFWITTSLVFSVAVSSHISNWLSSWMTGELGVRLSVNSDCV